jgi:hypothetical protein
MKKYHFHMTLVVLEELENQYWYVDIVYYIKNLTSPNHLIDHKIRELILKASICFYQPRPWIEKYRSMDWLLDVHTLSSLRI